MASGGIKESLYRKSRLVCHPQIWLCRSDHFNFDVIQEVKKSPQFIKIWFVFGKITGYAIRRQGQLMERLNESAFFVHVVLGEIAPPTKGSCIIL